jgi:hypothetical protein
MAFVMLVQSGPGEHTPAIQQVDVPGHPAGVRQRPRHRGTGQVRYESRPGAPLD